LARKSIILGIAVVAIIVIAGGYFGWTYINTNQNIATPSPSASATPKASETPETSPTPESTPLGFDITPSPSPEPQIFTVEQVRDAAMAYIMANHTETGSLMANLSWTGGRQDTGLLGSELYLYNGGNWTVEIRYPVVQNPVYTISSNYTEGDATVAWTGTCQNLTITETSYVANNLTDKLSTQENVRDAVMAYIKAYHGETAVYMQSLAWAGGRTTPEGIVGAETYSYQGSGWKLEMQYPVVPNPIYTVSANYTGRGMYNIVAWQGTLQNGTITETSYTYTP
jgi:uncharacterized protein (UPF0333 family)